MLPVLRLTLAGDDKVPHDTPGASPLLFVTVHSGGVNRRKQNAAYHVASHHTMAFINELCARLHQPVATLPFKIAVLSFRVRVMIFCNL